MTIAAIVLANGLSRRMGVEKAALLLGGQTLAARAVERLQSEPDVAAVALNAEGGSLRLGVDVPVVEDAIPDHAGPLAGIQAGMEWAAGEGHDRLVSAAVDTPFFPRDMVYAFANSSAPIVVAKTDRLHPVFALWHVDLAPALHRFLRRGGRKIMEFVEAHPFETRSFGGYSVDPFFNINTPEDYERAKALLS